MLLCARSKIIPTYKILMQKKTLRKAVLDFFTFQPIVLDHFNGKCHGANGSSRELWLCLAPAEARSVLGCLRTGPCPGAAACRARPLGHGGSCHDVTARCFSPQLRRGDAEGDAGPGWQRGGHQGRGQRRRLGPDGESGEAPRRHRRAGRVRRAAPAASAPAPVATGTGCAASRGSRDASQPTEGPQGVPGVRVGLWWGGRAQAPCAGGDSLSALSRPTPGGQSGGKALVSAVINPGTHHRGGGSVDGRQGLSGGAGSAVGLDAADGSAPGGPSTPRAWCPSPRLARRLGLISKTSAGLGCLAELVEAANEGVRDTERFGMDFLFFGAAARAEGAGAVLALQHPQGRPRPRSLVQLGTPLSLHPAWLIALGRLRRRRPVWDFPAFTKMLY